MSADIGVGDWVECIRGSAGQKRGFDAEGDIVVPGNIYRVRAIRHGHFPDGTLGTGLWLDGVKSFYKGIEGAWSINHFRPIRSDISEIEKLLKAPAPREPVKVTVHAGERG